jgi:hypothetical protein
VVDSCVSFERRWPWKLTSSLRPFDGLRRGLFLGWKLLCDAHASNKVPSTEKCSLDT